MLSGTHGEENEARRDRDELATELENAMASASEPATGAADFEPNDPKDHQFYMIVDLEDIAPDWRLVAVTLLMAVVVGKVADLIREQKSRGRTVFLTTHYMDEAEQIVLQDYHDDGSAGGVKSGRREA